MHQASVLLFYTDPYYLVKQVYPFGLGLIARYLRQYGHRVTVEYPFLPDPDVETNLINILKKAQPDIIGLGIRNLDTCLACEPYGDYCGEEFQTFYFLPRIRRMVDLIKAHSPGTVLIAGGGGFTISPRAVLQYLEVEYGVIGEGEEPFRQFVEAFPHREQIQAVSGLVYRDSDQIRINPKKPYSFSEGPWSSGREKSFQFALETVGLPAQVKRGCNQGCSYCVEPIIEGARPLYREMQAVVREIRSLSKMNDAVRHIFFVDTEFNLPDLAYPGQLVQRIIREGLHERFAFTSQFLPRPFDRDFARLLAEAGFSIILTCDSFSDAVLERNHVSYRRRDIENTLELCDEFAIPCTLSMIFGLPGETYKTVDDSIRHMKRYRPGPLRRYEYTVGGRIYDGTRLCRMIERGEGLKHVYGTPSDGYLLPCYFCAPESPFRLKHYIEEGLGYAIPYENPHDPAIHRSLAMAYLADQGRWQETISLFMESSLPSCMRIYDYLFRKLTAEGRLADARSASEALLRAIEADGQGSLYREQIGLIRFYLSCLGQ